jgi:hypothetical protein
MAAADSTPSVTDRNINKAKALKDEGVCPSAGLTDVYRLMCCGSLSAGRIHRQCIVQSRRRRARTIQIHEKYVRALRCVGSICLLAGADWTVVFIRVVFAYVNGLKTPCTQPHLTPAL